MATQAVNAGKNEKLRLAEIEHKNRVARYWAYFALLTFLLLSMAANVLTAWEYDLVSKIIAGVPPLSLFITSMLYERMAANRWIKAGMILTIIVSLLFSWYHIFELALDKHQPWAIAAFLPVVIDVPMLFAGTVLLRQAKTVKLPQTTRSRASAASAPKTVRTRTTPAKPTPSTKNPILST